MKRNIEKLTDRTHDLLIVGGGIFGASATWEAASRGIAAAMVDKGDFSQATSANHFKMVHGGIRYLQHGDLVRVRESSHERSALLRIAPHLVKPLPILIPTYGSGVKGRAFLGAGMLAYDLLTCDRNRGLQRGRRIPRGRFISRTEVLKRFPGLEKSGLTGGAVFCDGQMYNPPRIALSFIKSAAGLGALAANYVEVTGFIRSGNRIGGVKARDVLSGTDLEIRARQVLNTSGPWAHRLLNSSLGLAVRPTPTFSRDLAFVINRRFPGSMGLALASETKDADSILDRGGRHLFAVPWRGYTLIGVWHKVMDCPPEDVTVSADELASYMAEVNSAYPGLVGSIDDIMVVNRGLTLFGDEEDQGARRMSFGKRSQIIDHLKNDGFKGLTTVIGVRATTARGLAEKAVDLILPRLGKPARASVSSQIPIYGGDIGDFDAFLAEAIQRHRGELSAEQIKSLVHNYGSRYPEVLAQADSENGVTGPISGTTVLKAEVVHAMRREMACRLSDIVLRRTDLGTGSAPDENALETCADIAAAELGWTRERQADEIAALKAHYPDFDNDQ